MKRILIAAVASSLATGAVIAATGIAGSGDDDKTKPPQTMKQAFEQHRKQHDARLARIAKRLDVSTERLQDAMEKVRTNELNEAVESGRLTDAQRDAILACKNDPLKCDRSNLPAFRGHGGPSGGRRRGMHGRMRAHRQEFFSDLAKELDESAADVRKAFEAERPRFERRRGHGMSGPDGMGMGGPGRPGGGGPGGPSGFGGPDGPPGEPA